MESLVLMRRLKFAPLAKRLFSDEEVVRKARMKKDGDGGKEDDSFWAPSNKVFWASIIESFLFFYFSTFFLLFL